MLNAVYNGIADVLHVPRELEVMAKEWVSLNAKAQVDYEFDWPSAFSTLKVLIKVAPEGVRGLLPGCTE